MIVCNDQSGNDEYFFIFFRKVFVTLFPSIAQIKMILKIIDSNEDGAVTWEKYTSKLIACKSTHFLFSNIHFKEKK